MFITYRFKPTAVRSTVALKYKPRVAVRRVFTDCVFFISEYEPETISHDFYPFYFCSIVSRFLLSNQLMRPPILFVFLMVIGCTPPSTELQTEQAPLVRTNPNALDLTVAQQFIDTSRTSAHYLELLAWPEDLVESEVIHSVLEELNAQLRPTHVDLKDKPTHFVRLRKLNDTYVLYRRCDGMDPRFELRDSAFIQYGPHEATVQSMVSLVESTPSNITLNVHCLQSQSVVADTSKTDIVPITSISITQVDGPVYRIDERDRGFMQSTFVTPISEVGAFDMVVNHCPVRKVLEILD